MKKSIKSLIGLFLFILVFEIGAVGPGTNEKTCEAETTCSNGFVKKCTGKKECKTYRDGVKCDGIITACPKKNLNI